MIKIAIDDNELSVPAGTTIIEAADQIGVKIPRFCYHKKLSIAANCRMCLVEVEKAPKPLPACATPVMEGMKIYTKSQEAIKSQKAVMEFLLINHPLDCPICDQGGECELQDVSMGYGSDVSKYTEGKRVVVDNDLGALIATDMTRCINCTRCVRFCEEVAGERELGVINRGEDAEIVPALNEHITSEISGNVIDVCPVGALTSKPYRFTARSWEMKELNGISPHDGVGSNISYHVRSNKVMRVVPQENEEVNELWISDRDRFSYEAIASDKRLHEPMVKRDGKWSVVSWEQALDEVANELNGIKVAEGSDKIGALLSPSSTVEEFYLAQELIEGIGAWCVDHRLNQQDFKDQKYINSNHSLPISYQDLESLDAAFLVGSDIRNEQPILAIRLRKMQKNGGKLYALNPMHIDYKCQVAANIVPEQANLVYSLQQIVGQLHNIVPQQLPDWATADIWDVDTECEQAKVIANGLIENANSILLAGELANSHPESSKIRLLLDIIALTTRSKVSILEPGANSVGGWIGGCVPHLSAGGKLNDNKTADKYKGFWDAKLSGYILSGVDPILDIEHGDKVKNMLNQAKCVVALTSFKTPSLEQFATVMLPIAVPAENMGTYINLAGNWQSFRPVINLPGNVKPAWKVWRVMANVLGLDNIIYNNENEVLAAAKLKTSITGHYDTLLNNHEKIIGKIKWSHENKKMSGGNLVRVAPMPVHSADILSREANALQKTVGAGCDYALINSATAEKLKIQSNTIVASYGKVKVDLELRISESVANGTIIIDRGRSGTAGLSGSYAKLKIQEDT